MSMLSLLPTVTWPFAEATHASTNTRLIALTARSLPAFVPWYNTTTSQHFNFRVLPQFLVQRSAQLHSLLFLQIGL